MNPYTVIYVEPEDRLWQFYNCHADDPDHAEEQCLNANPLAAILWVNEGLSNTTME